MCEAQSAHVGEGFHYSQKEPFRNAIREEPLLADPRTVHMLFMGCPRRGTSTGGYEPFYPREPVEMESIVRQTLGSQAQIKTHPILYNANFSNPNDWMVLHALSGKNEVQANFFGTDVFCITPDGVEAVGFLSADGQQSVGNKPI